MSKKFLIIGVLSGLILFSGCTFFNGSTQLETKVNAQTVDQNQVDKKQPDLNRPEEKTVPEIKPPEETKTAEVQPNTQIQPDTEVQPTTTILKESPEVLLAKCLTEKGTKLFTASTCPHCKRQKALFNEGETFLPDTECAGPDGWAKVCTDAAISAVPTWIFANGEKLTGQTPLVTLAEKSGCTYTNNL